MREERRNNFKTGFVGYCCTHAEAVTHIAMLKYCGVDAAINVNRMFRRNDDDQGSFCIWVKPEDVIRAKEIRRGFKLGLNMLGSPYDVMLGLRAAVVLREGGVFERTRSRVVHTKQTRRSQRKIGSETGLRRDLVLRKKVLGLQMPLVRSGSDSPESDCLAHGPDSKP